MRKQILVTGSRDWEDVELIRSAIRSVYEPGAVLHHGGAKGADTIAGAYARGVGLEVIEHPAQWSTYGRRAGFLRNKEMVELQPDVVLAFQRFGSKGTQHTIDLAVERGIRVIAYRLTREEL
jgi:hypothetical protein